MLKTNPVATHVGLLTDSHQGMIIVFALLYCFCSHRPSYERLAGTFVWHNVLCRLVKSIELVFASKVAEKISIGSQYVQKKHWGAADSGIGITF